MTRIRCAFFGASRTDPEIRNSASPAPTGGTKGRHMSHWSTRVCTCRFTSWVQLEQFGTLHVRPGTCFAHQVSQGEERRTCLGNENLETLVDLAPARTSVGLRAG